MALLQYEEGIMVTGLGKNKVEDISVKLYGYEAVGIISAFTLKLNKDSKAYNKLMAKKIPSKDLIWFSLVTPYSGWPLGYLEHSSCGEFDNDDQTPIIIHRPAEDYIVNQKQLIDKERKLNFAPEYKLFPNNEDMDDRIYVGDSKNPNEERTSDDFIADGESFIYQRKDGSRKYFKLLDGYNGYQARVMQITRGQFMLDQAINGRFEALKAVEPTEEELNLLLSAFDLIKKEQINVEQFRAFELSLMTEEEIKNYPEGNAIKTICELADQQNFIAEKAKKLKPAA